MSDIENWEQGAHFDKYLLYPHNISARLAIDEVALSSGELMTVLTNRLSHGNKGKLVAIVHGTTTDQIAEVLMKIPLSQRNLVQEVTLDMAPNMAAAIRRSFPQARQVIDRFHVVRLMQEALQHLRIKHRWEAIEDENNQIELAKKNKQSFTPEILENGDTVKQLLARGRYLLYKLPSKWSKSQQQRAHLLFKRYPDLERAYKHTVKFRLIYNNNTIEDAKSNMMDWMFEAQHELTQEFASAARSIMHRMDNILNFFFYRSTNAGAESFNAKIKSFRALQRGVKDPKMFLFRLEKLYA